MQALKTTAEAVALEPPSDFEERAAAKWHEVIAGVRGAGGRPEQCLDLIRLYVVSWFDAVGARTNVAEHGVIVPAPRTGLPMPNPYHKVARDAEATCSRLARQLGLTGRRG